jgi:hypothetical protein
VTVLGTGISVRDNRYLIQAQTSKMIVPDAGIILRDGAYLIQILA